MGNRMITLKFKGNKDCHGRNVGGHTVNGMAQGSAYDVNGVVFARYRRMVVDGGEDGNYQRVDFFLLDDEK